MIDQKQYDAWRAAWQKEHPQQLPPTFEQVRTMQALFDLDDSTFEVPK